EDAVAALGIDVFFQVARERSDHFYFMGGEVFRQPVVGRSFDDGEVAAVYDTATARAGGLDQVTEILAQLGRAAGDVHDLRPMGLDPLPDATGGVSVHHLGAP